MVNGIACKLEQEVIPPELTHGFKLYSAQCGVNVYYMLLIYGVNADSNKSVPISYPPF